MAWYVAVDEKTVGPFDDQAVIEAIRGGLALHARICKVGEQQWHELAYHPPFAAELAKVAPPPPPSAPVAQPVTPTAQSSGCLVRAAPGLFFLVLFAGGIWWVGQSCSESNRQMDAERTAREQKADQAFNVAKAKLQATPPRILKDAREAIGDDPLDCKPDEYTREAICTWTFSTPGGFKVIKVFAEADRNGSAVHHVQFAEH